MQIDLFKDYNPRTAVPPGKQLLKWVGNKQRCARAIISHFPPKYGKYIEPFLGSGAILGALSPHQAVGSDIFPPLIQIWNTVKDDPLLVKKWYADRWEMMNTGDKVSAYENIKSSYNSNPNGADLLFLCRSCYGGVVRFRKTDGYMSTPCGVHSPISPTSFAARVDIWNRCITNTEFYLCDYREIMMQAVEGDIIYCDPPYFHSQSILYGAQAFNLEELFHIIKICKAKGVYVALSIDGKKRSGAFECPLNIPPGLFEREVFINLGRSMLKRFQMNGKTLEREVVSDRLLLTY